MSLNNIKNLLTKTAKTAFSSRQVIVRGFKDHEKSMRRSLYKRRLAQGPEPQRPASAWINWNYDMEVYCFGKRLNEDFNEDTLKEAFINRCYVEKEMKQREDLGIDSEAVMKDNQKLAEIGEQVINDHLTDYFTKSYSHLPQEGVLAIVAHLTSAHMLSYIAFHLGVQDLVLSHDFPPNDETMATCMKAIVGALYQNQGSERAGLFVRDLIAVQMVGKRVDDVWVVDNPMGLLIEQLSAQGLPAPEPRLLWSSGSNTVLSNYEVGIYCRHQLIGQSPGESVFIAEEMAARDALRNLYGIQDHHEPLHF